MISSSFLVLLLLPIVAVVATLPAVMPLTFMGTMMVVILGRVLRWLPLPSITTAIVMVLLIAAFRIASHFSRAANVALTSSPRRSPSLRRVVVIRSTLLLLTGRRAVTPRLLVVKLILLGVAGCCGRVITFLARSRGGDC